MYKFGVCTYSYGYDTNVSNLVTFDTYEKAYAYYMKKLEHENNCRFIPDNLWIVWIRLNDNVIIQMDQLSWKTHCKIIELEK